MILENTDLTPFQIDLDCPSSYEDNLTHSGEPNLAINCSSCFFWVGEDEDNIYCSYPRALKKHWYESGYEREYHGLVSRNYLWTDRKKQNFLRAMNFLYELHNSLLTRGDKNE